MNQNVPRECPEAKHYEGTVIRCSAEGTRLFLRPCLSISAASLSVYPHTASLIVELLCFSVCASPNIIPKMLPIDGGIVLLRKCLRILNGVLEIQMQRADVTTKTVPLL